MDSSMLDISLIGDLSSRFHGESFGDISVHSKVDGSFNEFDKTFDLDALEAYRDEVQAKNLNISYRSLMKYDEVEEPPAKKIRKSQSLQQDFQAAKVFLRNLRFEQERRDKHLEIELSKNERARKRAEFEIRQDAVLRYAKACQEENRLNELARHSQLIEEEKKFRSTLKLPIFVKFFFEIEENYFPALKEDALELIRHVWNGSLPDGEVFADEFGIKITRHDLRTLQGLNWLNDEVINFYINLIVRRSEMRNDLPKVYAFNTFFLQNLESKGYASVKRWTRKVDVFSYDILLVPVHLGNHWCLAAIDFKSQECNYYDSLGGYNQRCLDALRMYLEEEHKDKKKSAIDLSNWQFECRQGIPRQMNGSDCGVFTCCFAEFSSRHCELKFDQRIMQYYRQRMVYEICKKELMI